MSWMNQADFMDLRPGPGKLVADSSPGYEGKKLIAAYISNQNALHTVFSEKEQKA